MNSRETIELTSRRIREKGPGEVKKTLGDDNGGCLRHFFQIDSAKIVPLASVMMMTRNFAG